MLWSQVVGVNKKKEEEGYASIGVKMTNELLVETLR
jgi:hypothetical protein